MSNTFTPRERIQDENNPFVLKEDSYQRDIYLPKHALNQYAWMIHLQTGTPFEEAKDWVKNHLKSGKFQGVRNPRVHYLKRGDNGDRAPTECHLTEYIQETITEKEIMAPTFTTYTSDTKNKSFIGKYLAGKIKSRSKAKKAKFMAKMKGDVMGELYAEGEQRNTKLEANACSGAHSSASNPLYNQTNHSTLTSNCRMTSGNGNANNEKLLAGNRHYFTPEVVINNIYSITQNTDYDHFEAMMQKYQLHYPTVRETLEVIHRSTRMYWQGSEDDIKVAQVVLNLNPIQRAAFVYTSDLYHIRKYNDQFMRDFLKELTTTAIGDNPNPIEILSKLPEDYVNLAHQLCEDEWEGVSKDYESVFQTEEGKKKLHYLEGTASHVLSVVKKYKDFIRCIFVSDNSPAAVPYFPTSIRRAALASDTDSTIFTVQEWVHWYCGEYDFGIRGCRLGATMIFLASQAITHILAIMSINAGVSRENMWLIAMKNEFFFLIFSPTEVTKHYWALIRTQEGNVYKDPEMEVKGVHLISSNAPKIINQHAKQLMRFICEETIAGRKISLSDLLAEVGVIEKFIHGLFEIGDAQLCRRAEIKTPDSYSQEESQSNFQHHLFWKEVFAPKFGLFDEPPYQCVRLTGSHETPKDTQEWLEAIKPKYPETAQRVKDYMKKYNKKKLGAFWVPKSHVDVHGIPEELLMASNLRKQTADIASIYYLILRNLGYYGLDKNNHILISDRYGNNHSESALDIFKRRAVKALEELKVEEQKQGA